MLGSSFFYSINLKFYEKPFFFLFVTKFSLPYLPPLGRNGGVKKKCSIDWIKNEVAREVLS